MGEEGHWRVGAVTVTRMIERRTELAPSDFLPSANDLQLAAHADWLKPWALDDAGQLLFAIQAIGVEYAGQKIVVDTCVGPRRLPEIYAWVANDGSFITALTEAGFGRDDVDLVICTHLHFDHVGWNTILEGGRWLPTFRRARYLVAKTEYDYWKAASEEDQASQSVFNLEDAVTPLFDAGVVDLVDTDHRVNDAVRLLPTPGHTPGHVSVRIGSGGEEALITGDCAHHPVQLAEPDWFSLADNDRGLSSATRRRLIADFADTRVLIIGTHFRPPTAGHLVTEDGRVRFHTLAQ
jgi:glyoxylase-like metal-dependent hydrolase (beta-lactamase superfamily II)